ncbi:MAG: CYTH domain-containing protein [Tabrizicola sp.]|nr:CYTH domain-containing protein [Tabrizicola sp.]
MGVTPTETELKLVCTPAALRKLMDSSILDAHAVGEPTTAALRTTYFDTEDDRLARRRMSLRVRREGQRRVQTLKAVAADGASLDSRYEWEVEVGADEPDLSGTPYRLIEEIGHGGMGVVYRARQRSLNRIVALKTILSAQFATPEDVQRFRAEATAAGSRPCRQP